MQEEYGQIEKSIFRDEILEIFNKVESVNPH